MIDNLKIRTYNQAIINRLLGVGGFVVCKSLSNRFDSIQHKDTEKLKIHFFKVKGGFGFVDISLSPHYHFNGYRHNGNDFSVIDCIKTLKEILHLIGIKDTEFSEFQPVNLEFGVNTIPHQDTLKIIEGVSFYKKTKFKLSRTNGGELEYSKILDATSEKQIKIYAKGLQCHEVLNAQEVNINTLRYEIKSKKSRYLKKLGISSVNNLLDFATYNKLGQELIEDFKHILILNLSANLEALNPKERDYIIKANKVNFWDNLKTEKSKDKFARHRVKYIKITHSKKIKHPLNLEQKIGQKITFLSEEFSPKRSPINKGNFKNKGSISDVIKGENSSLSQTSIIKHLENIIDFNNKIINKRSRPIDRLTDRETSLKLYDTTNIKDTIKEEKRERVSVFPKHEHKESDIVRRCIVTGLDISMQKRNSSYLCFSGLKYYLTHAPEIYRELEKRYLTTKAKDKDLDTQIYYIAHNIRNTKTNIIHNRRRYEERNILEGQLSFNFDI